ncbi:MAG: LacI family DNA-binding transcriptional regulator [Alphaproteobacteria bacterium]|nr:LacI family DNA-binding transcriptional regulator [Alphaproteobacteria bacterium]
MATVLDVARRAGVSSATVSRVLSGHGNVGAETRERVLQAVRDLDFQPNRFAQGLRRGRGNTVALLVGDIEQSVYSALTKHLQVALGEIGLDLMLYNLDHSAERLRTILEAAPAMGLRGVALASTDVIPMATVGPLLRALQQRAITVIAIGQRLHRAGIPSIVHEERAAGRRAVAYLVEQGRAPVAYVGRIAGSAVGSERYRGYCAALAAAGLALRPELVSDVSYRFAAGYEGTSRVLAAAPDVRGVQAGSDELALGAMAAIRDHGLRVPEDVAVVGFGNIDWGAHVRPALTTLSVHPATVAHAVAALLRDGAGGPLLQVIARTLVLRGSA